jgi:hypothetical protein
MSGVHDHIRLRQHQISAIAFIGVRIRTGQVKDPGTTKGGEAMGGSSGGGEFSPGWSSAEMARRSCSLTVVEETPNSVPTWRRVQPWAYKSAARFTSTAPP